MLFLNFTCKILLDEYRVAMCIESNWRVIVFSLLNESLVQRVVAKDTNTKRVLKKLKMLKEAADFPPGCRNSRRYSAPTQSKVFHYYHKGSRENKIAILFRSP